MAFGGHGGGRGGRGGAPSTRAWTSVVNPPRMYGSTGPNPSMLREGNIGMKQRSFFRQDHTTPAAGDTRQEGPMAYDYDEDELDFADVGKLGDLVKKAGTAIKDRPVVKKASEKPIVQKAGKGLKSLGRRVQGAASAAAYDWKEKDLSPAVQVRVRGANKVSVTNIGTGDKPKWQVEPLIGMLAAGSSMNVGALGVLTAAKAGIRGAKAAGAKVKGKLTEAKNEPFRSVIAPGQKVVIGYLRDGSIQDYGDEQFDEWDAFDPGADDNLYTGMEEDGVGAVRRRPLLSALVPGSGLARRLAARRRARRAGVGDLPGYGDADLDVWDTGMALGYVADGSIQDYGDRFNDAFDSGYMLGELPEYGDADMDVWDAEVDGVHDTIRAAKRRNKGALQRRIGLMQKRIAARRAQSAGVGYLFDGSDNLSGDAAFSVLGALEDDAELIDTDGFRVKLR